MQPDVRRLTVSASRGTLVKTVISITFCVALTIGFASAQQDSTAKNDPALLLIGKVQATPAAKLDSTLPQVSLQEWLSQQIGADATVAWVVRTGMGDDLPWVEADISVGNRPAIVIMIACGRHNWVTRSRPMFKSLLLYRQGEFVEWPHLHDLPVAMRQARGQS